MQGRDDDPAQEDPATTGDPTTDARRPSPTDPATVPESSEPTTQGNEPAYLRLGRYAWASIGLAGVLVLLCIVISRLSLVIIPVVLALFPAALLMPVAQWLKGLGVPPALASILTILGLLGALAGVFVGLGVFAAGEIPELRESLVEGVRDLEETIEEDPLNLGYDFPGFGPLFDEARGSLTDGGDGEGGEEGVLAGGAAGAASTVTEGLTGIILVIVVLFFYLKDEGRLSAGVIATMPQRWRRHATELASRFWRTTGAYFRGQLLVALVDAVFIGLGLVLLGIPLAIPLAVLVFFGALFPIVGAFVSGGVAVLVALADAGLVRALMVLLLIVVVQQLEGNVLEPVILSSAISLHPLVIILALTAGSVLLGILGAFLAVPVAASFARGLDYARSEMDGDGSPIRAEIPSHT